MKTTSNNRGFLRTLTTLAVMVPLLLGVKFAAQATSITFSAPANCAADTDVVNSGGGQLAATTWGGATVINGVAFTTSTAVSGAVGSSLRLAGFTSATPSAFAVDAAPFNTLSGSYSNLLRGAVYNGVEPINSIGTVMLTNLTVGHNYFVQLWVSDPRAATADRVEYIYSGGGATNLLRYNSTLTDGGVGQFTYATFTADATSQDITLDASLAVSPDTGALQLNAIQLRELTGAWSGTTSGNWTDPDSTTANFSGASYNAVKAIATNVYFGDLDAAGNAVATSAILVGVNGVTGANANFNNNAVNYTLASADANGIKGAYGITLDGSGNVTLNGANTYTGETRINSGTLRLGHTSAVSGSAALVLNGGTLDTTAATLSLASGQTLRGAGAVNGSLTAGSGSTIVLGTGTGSGGTLNVTNNLTLNGQSFTFDLPLSPVVGNGDQITVGGVLTLNGNSVITLNQLSSVLADGTYTLVTYASKSGGNFTLNTAYPGIAINNGPTGVTLTVTGHGGAALWLSNPGNTNWSADTNWGGSVLPSTGDSLVINDTTPVNALWLDDTSHTIGKLVMGLSGTRTNAFTFRSTTNELLGTTTNQLILAKGLFATNDASLFGPTLTIQTPVTVQGDQTWTVASTPADAGTVYIPRGVMLASSGFGINTSATNTVLTLNGTLIKDGLGLLRFGGGVQQTNGGSIFVKQGTLLLDATSFPRLLLAPGGSIIVTNGATLVLAGAFTTYNSVQKQVDMLTGSTLAINVTSVQTTECPTPVHWNGTNTLVFQSPGGAAAGFNFTNANWTGTSVVTFSNSTIAQGIYLGLKGSNAGFSGKFIYNGGASAGTQNLLRFFSNDSGSPNAEWVLNSPTTPINATMEIYPPATTVQLGALSGPNGTIRPVGNFALKTMVVGALNTSTTCGASIIDTAGYLALVKVGSGTLTLTSDLSTNTGGTIISNGALASMSAIGSSVGWGPVSIMSGARFSGIGQSTQTDLTNYVGGTLDTPGGTPLHLRSLTLGTISTDLTTSSINVGNGGLIDSGSSLTVNGTNIINITGSGTNVGSYDLISYNSIGGAGIFKLGALPPGVTATLDDSGTAVQLNVTAYTPINTNPTNITFTVSGGSMNLSWPSDHQGWHLQCQTNSRATGLGAAWVTIPGSAAITSTNIPINPSNPTVFYRLVYP